MLELLGKHRADKGSSGSAMRPWRSMLDLLLPPQCLICREPCSHHGMLCGECFGHMQFLGDPQCIQCGQPFTLMVEKDTRCGECLASPPPYRFARAVCAYDSQSRRLVTALKYHDQTWLAPALGRWMQRAVVQPDSINMIVPVPLHHRRLWWRTYNQSMLLATSLARYMPAPVMPQLLVRTRRTTPQTGLSKRQRQLNVRGAFAVNPRYEEQVQGKRVLLIDDVITTGATIHACCKALDKAGAASVDVVTFGRRVLEGTA